MCKFYIHYARMFYARLNLLYHILILHNVYSLYSPPHQHQKTHVFTTGHRSDRPNVAKAKKKLQNAHPRGRVNLLTHRVRCGRKKKSLT